jgi:uncharacterized protein (DUF2147 family)
MNDMNFRKIIILFVLSITIPEIVAQKDADYFPDLCGVWLSENKKQKVRVIYDAKSKSYTGRLEWMYEDDASQGRKLLDVNNPNPKLKTRRVTGINFLHSFKSEGGNKFRGYIYDPISGKEYRCLMTLRPDRKTAEIRGYILIPWIGRTEIATKVSN